jgi:hypothetical protein
VPARKINTNRKIPFIMTALGIKPKKCGRFFAVFKISYNIKEE